MGSSILLFVWQSLDIRVSDATQPWKGSLSAGWQEQSGAKGGVQPSNAVARQVPTASSMFYNTNSPLQIGDDDEEAVLEQVNNTSIQIVLNLGDILQPNLMCSLCFNPKRPCLQSVGLDSANLNMP